MSTVSGTTRCYKILQDITRCTTSHFEILRIVEILRVYEVILVEPLVIPLPFAVER